MSDYVDREVQKNIQAEELRLVMQNDLGASRREENFTVDHKYKHKRTVDIANVMKDRSSEKKGTLENEQAKLHALSLKGWSNLAANPEDGPLDPDISAGQAHRIALNATLHGTLPTQNFIPQKSGKLNANLDKVSTLSLTTIKAPLPKKLIPSKFSAPQVTPIASSSRGNDPPRLWLGPALEPRRHHGLKNLNANRKESEEAMPRLKLSTQASTRGIGVRQDRSGLSKSDERKRVSKSNEINVRGLKMQLNHVVSQSSLRSTTDKSDPPLTIRTNGKEAARQHREEKIAALSASGWNRHQLASNDVDGTSTNPLFTRAGESPSHITTPRTGRRQLRTEHPIFRSIVKREGTIQLTDPHILIDVSQNIDENRPESPKTQNIEAHQLYVSSEGCGGELISIVEESKEEAITDSQPNTSQLVDRTCPGIDDTTLHSEPFMTYSSGVPDIRQNSRDPLATQTREKTLQSEKDFWIWYSKSKLSGNATSQCSTTETTPTTPTVPNAGIATLPTLSNVSAAGTAQAVASTRASIQPPNNVDQWTSPAQEQFREEARPTILNSNNVPTSASVHSDPHSPTLHRSSTSHPSSVDVSNLTRQFNTWSLSSRTQYRVEDSDDEGDHEEEKNNTSYDDEDDTPNTSPQHTSDRNGSIPEADTFIIGGARLHLRDILNVFPGMTEQEVRDRYRPSKSTK